MAMIEGAAIGSAAIGSSPVGGGGFLGGSGTGPTASASDGLLMSESYVVSRGYVAAITDGAEWSEDFVLTDGAILREHLGLSHLMILNSVSNVSIVDQTKLVDRIAWGVGAAVLEGVGIGIVEEIQRAVSVVESLGLTGTPLAAGVYSKIISEVAKLRETFSKQVGADIDEAIALMADLFGISRFRPAVTEDVTIDVAPTVQLLVHVKLAEGVDIHPTTALQLLFSATIVEGLELELALVEPNGSLTSWSINTRTGAVGEYSNFDFNSFAQIGSIAYGASATGLYEMLGPDDDGDGILARIKSGYMQFGGTHLSRLKDAYIAVRSADAKVLLKIVTADNVEYIYQVDTRSMRNTKVNMGKGMRARYFAFELTTEGQDFDLDTIEFVPIVVQRRV